MGNSTSDNNKLTAGQNETPANQPGAPKNQTSSEGQPEGVMKSSKNVAAKKKVGEGDEYRLLFSTDTQNGTYTFDDQADKFYSQIVVQAPKFELESRPSLDIVACIDVSGSMSGQKISLVRKSMRRLVRNLGSEDRFALVTFDSNVRTVMDFCKLDEVNKKRCFDLISNLRAGTSTNLCGGLVEGVEQLLNNRVNDVASVLLFTDGEANVGHRDTHAIVNEVLRTTGMNQNKVVESWTVDEVCAWLNKIDLNMYAPTFQQQRIAGDILKFDLNRELLTETLNVNALHVSKFMREVEKLRGTGSVEGEGSEQQNQGFRLHTFGFGSDHNSTLLRTLAEQFEGMYFFMEDEESIKSGFANCLGGLMTTVALNIEVAVQFNPECQNGKIYKENVTEKDGIHKVIFADLQSEEKRNILVSCSLPAKEAPDDDFLLYEANFIYTNAVENCQSNDVVSCVVIRNGKIDDFNEEVDETRNRELAAHALREANMFGEKKDLKSARERLQITIDELDKSKSCNSAVTQNLRRDLKTALKKSVDVRTWKNEGAFYTVQNYMCYEQQRACNFDPTYAAQCDYNTSTRETMNEVWQRADSLDSDCGDDYLVD